MDPTPEELLVNHDDPIDRLLAEHVDLMARLAPLRAAVKQLASAGSDALEPLLPSLRAAALLLTTDLIAHARREDDVFFPAVEAAVGEPFGPTTVMRSEHAEIHAGADRFRDTLRELNEVQHPAIVAGGQELRALVERAPDAKALVTLAGPLLALIDDHFAKEEQVLFPMSRQLLSPAALRDVAARMAQLDAS